MITSKFGEIVMTSSTLMYEHEPINEVMKPFKTMQYSKTIRPGQEMVHSICPKLANSWGIEGYFGYIEYPYPIISCIFLKHFYHLNCTTTFTHSSRIHIATNRNISIIGTSPSCLF